MKKVHTNSMVCHLWANQSQSEAQNASRSIFFEDTELFSYRRSFKIGHIMNSPNGERVYFISNNYYSNTTAKHINNAVRAIPEGYDTFSFDFLDKVFGYCGFNSANVHKALEIYERNITEFIGKQCKAVKSESYLIDATQQHTKYQRLAQLWGLEFKPLREFAQYDEACAKFDLIRQKNIISQTLREEREKKEREKQILKETEKLEKWLKGEFHGTLYAIPVHLRLSTDGTEIETTRGASVPVLHAVRLWNAIKEGQDIKGHRIGSFMAMSNDGQTIRIGCHDIKMSIAEQFMSQFSNVEA